MTTSAYPPESTASKVLAHLDRYDLTSDGNGQYHANSPLRPGSNSHAFTITINGPEHGAYYDHVTGESGSIYNLAELMDIPTPTNNTPESTKRGYTGLDDYAAAHGVAADVFKAAGWRETRRENRPALLIPTTAGDRYRFIDGGKPTYKSTTGYKACLYGLDRAVQTARETGHPLVLANGEASVVAAQHYGVAAIAVTGGENNIASHLRGGLLAELQAAWDGPTLIALDCDDTGRKAAHDVAALLPNAKTVDLGGSNGFDLADFCRLHDDPAADLAKRATEKPAEAAEPARFAVKTEDDLMALPPLTYLDRELCIVARAYHLIYGPSGSGKTFFAIERAMRLAAAGYRVLYVPTEDLSGLRYRVAAWRKAHPEAEGNLTWLHMPEGLDLQDHNQVADLLEAIAPYKYDHVVIDTLREAHSGDENSSQDTRRINRAIQNIIASGAGVDVVHHAGVAGERPRGSTALYGNNDVVIEIDNNDGQVQAVFKKLRAPQREPLSFGIVQQDTGLLDHDGEPVISAILRPAGQVTQRGAKLSQNGRRILEALSLSVFETTGASSKKLLEAAGMAEGKTFYRTLSTLKNNGYIRPHVKGDPYYITGAGRAQLGPELTPTVTDNSPPLSPTVTTVTPLSQTVMTEPTALSVTVTTLKGDRDDSRVTVENDIFATVPTSKRTFLRLYLRSNKNSDQERARDLCSEYGIDYNAALAALN